MSGAVWRRMQRLLWRALDPAAMADEPVAGYGLAKMIQSPRMVGGDTVEEPEYHVQTAEQN